MQLDEVRRQSGGKAGLPMVPEEEPEDLPQHNAAGIKQMEPTGLRLHGSRSEAASSSAVRQQQPTREQIHHLSASQREPAERAQHAGSHQRSVPELHEGMDMLEQADDLDLMPANSKDIRHQQQQQQLQQQGQQQQQHQGIQVQAKQQAGLSKARCHEMQGSKTTRQDANRQAATQLHETASHTHLHRFNRQPVSPLPHQVAGHKTADAAGAWPLQQGPAVSPTRAVGNRPVPLRAGLRPPAKEMSPVMAHAVEHSSLSLSQRAGAGRSKLRPPSSLNSPPKRASRAPLPKQATNSHLVKLAAAIPLPASPNGDVKQTLEPTAAAALATAVAKTSHIPAPAVKPSRLKKPTDTSGFFSSGRSFTGGASNSRCLDILLVFRRQLMAPFPTALSDHVLRAKVSCQLGYKCFVVSVRPLQSKMTCQTCHQ